VAATGRNHQVTAIDPNLPVATGHSPQAMAIAHSLRAVVTDRSLPVAATARNHREGIGLNLRATAIARNPVTEIAHHLARIRNKGTTGITAASNRESTDFPLAAIQALPCQAREGAPPHELQESIEQPARDFAHSGRFCA
jgi:hypothetical protein